jgi:hypothetical protein
MPEGMPSREQLDRYRAAHQEKKESPDSVQTPHGGPEPAAPPAKPAVEGEPPPSKETQATQVVGQVAGTTNAAGTVASAKPSSPAQPDIRELCRTLIPAGRIVEDKAETLGAAAAEAATLRDGVLAAPHAAGAAAKMTPLRKLAESADADRKEEEKQRAVLFAAASSVDALRRATEEKKEKERQETEKRRKLAEQRAAAEKEMERVKRLPEENRSFVARNDFAGALAAAQAVAAGLATDEAKSAARVLTDRYACLNELKAFLIERLNAEPFQWGWGFGATALDVLGATESEVKLKAKTVYWLDVSMPQMLKFIERYVPDKKVRMRTRGRLCLATAILCEEHGQTENKDKYRKKAVELASDLEAEAARLLSP